MWALKGQSCFHNRRLEILISSSRAEKFVYYLCCLSRCIQLCVSSCEGSTAAACCKVQQYHLVQRRMASASHLHGPWTTAPRSCKIDGRRPQTPANQQPVSPLQTWDGALGAGCAESSQCIRCVAGLADHLQGQRTPWGRVDMSSTDLQRWQPQYNCNINANTAEMFWAVVSTNFFLCKTRNYSYINH